MFPYFANFHGGIKFQHLSSFYGEYQVPAQICVRGIVSHFRGEFSKCQTFLMENGWHGVSSSSTNKGVSNIVRHPVQ